jgi:glycosyltransferase involved in cell wall biosynthesis
MKTQATENDRVLLIAYKYSDQDARILRERAALLDRGCPVDMICPRHPQRMPKQHAGLRLFSPTMLRRRGSKARYLFEYLVFFLYAFLMAARLHLKHRYKVVMVFVMPEALVFCALIPKLLGARILMDWEDPAREVFLSKFHGRSERLFLALIDLFEKLSVRFSNHIITPNEGFRRAFVERGVPAAKISIVMNAPDTGVFEALPATDVPPTSPFTILYHGGVLERSGLDIAIRAMPEIIKRIPDARLVIIGTGEFTDTCLELARTLGVNEHVAHEGRVYLDGVPSYITRASVGVIPNRDMPFTRINFPQRSMELALMRRPILAPRLPGIEDYLDDRNAFLFTPDCPEDLARKAIEIYDNPDDVQRRLDAASAWLRTVGWDKMKARFLAVLEGLGLNLTTYQFSPISGARSFRQICDDLESDS